MKAKINVEFEGNNIEELYEQITDWLNGIDDWSEIVEFEE